MKGPGDRIQPGLYITVSTCHITGNILMEICWQCFLHSEKKGYQNGATGVLLLQMVLFFQRGIVPLRVPYYGQWNRAPRGTVSFLFFWVLYIQLRVSPYSLHHFEFSLCPIACIVGDAPSPFYHIWSIVRICQRIFQLEMYFCSNNRRLLILMKMSFTDLRGGLKCRLLHFPPKEMQV